MSLGKNERYYSLNRYLHDVYGEKLYKLALDGNMTCPNRDGKFGTRGCIFCSAGGSGEFAQPMEESVTQQIEKAKWRIAGKTNAKRFIAYFQNYTNTYASIEYLEKIFTEAILHPNIAVLSIATRPDCLGNEVILLLEKLNQIKPVWIEFGLQTVHEKTVQYIRRGYSLSVFEDAVLRLRNIKIPVVVHVILGLPSETRQDMEETVKYVAQSGVMGIKLQLLHVLKGTDLADEYEQGKFSVLSKEEYLDIVTDMLKVLPSNMVIHRLTGDGPKRLLIAPLWSADKKDVLNSLNGVLQRKDIRQGTHFLPLT